MGRRAKDLVGRRFGRLVVVGRAASASTMHARWQCLCDCGKDHSARGSHLTVGRVTSCGCGPPGIHKYAAITHGHAGAKRSGAYSSWAAMHARCSQKEGGRLYRYYGGRGIVVCERWKSFANFLADMGNRPEGHTLDRIDNSGNYEPGNCRWITQREQLLNTRRTRTVEYQGQTKTLHEWCELLGLDREKTRHRLKYAPPERVFARAD